MILSIPKPGNIFIQVRGKIAQEYVTEIDPLMRRDIRHNYFGLEVNHIDEVAVFDNFLPGKFGVDFSGSTPEFKFKQVIIPSPQVNSYIEKFNYMVHYYLVLSKDPYIMSYYDSCSDFYVSTFYPDYNKSTKMKNIYQVHKFSTIQAYKEKKADSNGFDMEDEEGWVRFKPKTQKRTVYYASVFADIRAKPKRYSERAEDDI